MKKIKITLSFLLMVSFFVNANLNNIDILADEKEIEVLDEEISVEEDREKDFQEEIKEDVISKNTNNDLRLNDEGVNTDTTLDPIVEDQTLNEELIITNEAELINALSLAKENETITILGGLTINLSSRLDINSDQIDSLIIQSSDEKEVVINNDVQNRHFVITGSNDLSLKFNNIILKSEVAGYSGIETTTAKNVVIDGLVYKDSFIKSKNLASSGFIRYKSEGNITIKNMLIDNVEILEQSMENSHLIYLETNDSNINLENIDISNVNINNLNGGNIKLEGYNNKVVAKDLRFKDIHAYKGSPGIYSGLEGLSELTVENSLFMSNVDETDDIGVLNLTARNNGLIFNVKNSHFENNYADRGGAAIRINSYKDYTLNVSESSFINNEAGIIKYDPSTGTSSGLPGNGAAIYISQTGGYPNLNIDGSTFDGNKATDGGAIYVSSTREYVNTIIDKSTFKNNYSDYMGGAIHFRGVKDGEDAILSIKNSEIMNNKAEKVDLGEGWNQAGEGGGIYFNELRSNPYLIKLDSVNFKDNNSAVQNYWSYTDNSNSELDKAYTKNIKNVSYSASALENDNINRNNVFNGDDIHFDKTAYMLFDLNPNGIQDLDISNYSSVKWNVPTYKNQHFPTLETPKAEGYKFIAWVDENGREWDFENDILVEGAENSWYYLKAKWEKEESYTIVYTDGVANEDIFSDQITIIKKGDKTPDFLGGIPERKGYSFLGWSPSLSEYVDADTTYTAIWKIQDKSQSKVTFNYIDTEGNTINPSWIIEGDVGSKYIVSPISIQGYTFIEVQDDESTSGIFTDTEKIVNIIYRKNKINPPVDKDDGIKPPVTEDEVKSPLTSNTNVPNTGINDKTLIYALLLIISAGLVYIGYRKKAIK